MSWLKRLICGIGLHGPCEIQEAVVILSVYQRCECDWCGDVSYYVIGMGGIDRVDFVPLPWSEEGAEFDEQR